MALTAFLSLLASPLAQAQNLNPATLNGWAKSTIQELTAHCDQISHAEWMKKYNSAGMSLVDHTKKLSAEDVKEASDLDSFSDLGEIILPELLPVNYPSKGSFLACVDYFDEFKNAPTNAKGTLAIKHLEDCYHASYREDPPELIQSYLKCLRAIKKY